MAGDAGSGHNRGKVDGGHAFDWWKNASEVVQKQYDKGSGRRGTWWDRVMEICGKKKDWSEQQR